MHENENENTPELWSADYLSVGQLRVRLSSDIFRYPGCQQLNPNLL
jgi:hypothetical protein